MLRITLSAPVNLRVSAMAETVYLKNGSMEVILEDKGVFLERLIREHMGDDVARCFTEYVTELQDDLKYAQEGIEEQERVADGYHSMCNDALDAFKEVLELLESPRLSRKDLKGAVLAGYDNLNKNL